MRDLNALIRDYCAILDQEHQLSERKERLRAAITEAMTAQKLHHTRTEAGSAARVSRFKLLPKQELVLGLLSPEDLFPFASFTPARVKELLVPKYGRERLLPLFEVQKTEILVIRRPQRGS